MKETKVSQEALGLTAFKGGQKWLRGRFCTLMLMAALCLAGMTATALAQSCFETCQHNLADCMEAAGGDTYREVVCQNVYDKCGLDCM